VLDIVVCEENNAYCIFGAVDITDAVQAAPREQGLDVVAVCESIAA